MFEGNELIFINCYFSITNPKQNKNNLLFLIILNEKKKKSCF